MKNKIISIVCIIISTVFFSCNRTESLKTKKNLTLSLYMEDLEIPQKFDDEIAKKITERTGIELEILYAGKDESVDLMIANQKYPDLIFAKSGLSKLIEAKAITPLDDYIEKYGSNMKKLYGDQIVKLRYTLEDPQIYTMGTYGVHNTVSDVSGTIQIQHAVLKEFGYPQVKTLEDVENILKAYIKKYPIINGKPAVGFSLLCDHWYWYIGLSNPGNYILGYPDDGQWIVDENTLEVTYKFLKPEMKTFYKWLNKIYHEGLLDPESFTQSKELWEEKLSTGNVLGTSFAYWGLSGIQSNLRSKDLTHRTYAYLPVTADESIKDPSLKDYGFSGGWGIAISETCKDKDRAFKFLDWMCSEEAQILLNWGIIDKHYKYDENGKRFLITNDSITSGIGKWVYPFPQAGTGYIDSTGNTVSKNTKEELKLNYSSAEKETLKAYGVEYWDDLFPSAKELGVSRHGQVWQYPLSSKMTDRVSYIDEIVKKELIKMIISPEKDFDNSWNSMGKKITGLGINEAGQEISNLIKIKIDLWK